MDVLADAFRAQQTAADSGSAGPDVHQYVIAVIWRAFIVIVLRCRGKLPDGCSNHTRL